MTVLPPREAVPGFESLGVTAFTTTREAGSFNLGSSEPAAAVFARWWGLLEALAPVATRLACAHQVHADRVLSHSGAWAGWLRAPEADGHFSLSPGTALAVSLADCVPVFLAHPSGAVSVLHSGWKGTVARIVRRGIACFEQHGMPVRELHVHLGPAICGRCYVVGPDVVRRLTGESAESPRPVDLRALIAADARAAGVRHVSTTEWCTRCDNERFFSHRAGDSGRQVGVIARSA